MMMMDGMFSIRITLKRDQGGGDPVARSVNLVNWFHVQSACFNTLLAKIKRTEADFG